MAGHWIYFGHKRFGNGLLFYELIVLCSNVHQLYFEKYESKLQTVKKTQPKTGAWSRKEDEELSERNLPYNWRLAKAREGIFIFIFVFVYKLYLYLHLHLYLYFYLYLYLKKGRGVVGEESAQELAVHRGQRRYLFVNFLSILICNCICICICIFICTCICIFRKCEELS